LPAQPAARPARSPGRRLDQLPGRLPGTGADLLGDTANGPAGVVDRLAHLLAGLSHRPTRADSLLGLSADLVQRPGARPAGAERRLRGLAHLVQGAGHRSLGSQRRLRRLADVVHRCVHRLEQRLQVWGLRSMVVKARSRMS
jgi:hypothetical protein